MRSAGGRLGRAGLLVGGLLLGAVIAGTLTANAETAATTSPPAATSDDGTTDDAPLDPSQPQRADEELLTGDTLTQVTEAALAEYPGATIERVETDSDGVYEAHLITADGERVTVELDADFTVTGTEAGGLGGPGRHGPGHGGHLPPDSTTTGSSTDAA